MADQRLYQKVANNILALIASGQYPPGTRLPGERELATQFGVSRVVVREAEIALEALGRVDIRVGSGVYVLEKTNTPTGALPTVSAFELTQTRLLFESECAALAATMITDAQLAELEETLNLMSVADGNSSDGEEADRNFHLLITKATRNEANMFFMENLWRMRTEIEAVKKVYSAVCVVDSGHRAEEHMEIFKNLKNRDAEGARNAMRTHFTRLLSALLDASEQQAIEEARRKISSEREQFLKSALHR
ncbi:FadR/GntR family transcriptional regulator [Hirschia baltica]|uniref:GntR domain protein n=1 Tax=Hirschia baltica (strain ATCC 49814 / DSM 5838 / IFAM 1418) TaxID=582402 RepID=C6XQE8_HIRBI|nr:FadR/GntR family transcriptional regulator [Hirschia baltica]ACT60447.1 GntR domain protein [Hirschia baltica ATCC 49814]